jgi:hypothetical protein
MAAEERRKKNEITWGKKEKRELQTCKKCLRLFPMLNYELRHSDAGVVKVYLHTFLISAVDSNFSKRYLTRLLHVKLRVHPAHRNLQDVTTVTTSSDLCVSKHDANNYVVFQISKFIEAGMQALTVLTLPAFCTRNWRKTKMLPV